MKNKKYKAAKLLMTVCKEKLIVPNNILLYCIDNESNEKEQNWKLKEHMKIFVSDLGCDPNIKDSKN